MPESPAEKTDCSAADNPGAAHPAPLPSTLYILSMFKTRVLTNICPLLLTGRVALLSGNLTSSCMRVMTACRAGWHNSETPDREVTISRGFPFCFKCVWPLPQQLNVSKCSFWNLLLFHSPHFYINPESEGLTNLKVSQERPRKQPILVCKWLDPLMSFALSLHNHMV